MLSLGIISCGSQPSEEQLQQTRSQLSQVKPLEGKVSKQKTRDLLAAQKNAQTFLLHAQHPAERTVAIQVLDRFNRQIEVQSQIPTAESFIVNGKRARKGQFPYQAALVFTGYANAYDGQYCAATLIDPQWVLTAGHCVLKAMQPGDIQVVLDIVKLSDGGRRYDLASVCRHPQYKVVGGHSENDLALLKLATRVPDLTPIGTPDGKVESTVLQFSRNATISGWGDTGSGDHAGSDNLLFGTVSVIENRICNKNYPPGQILDGMVCTTEKLTSTCHGDSGGPLIVRTREGMEYIEGVTSWGDKDCAQGNPSVYTRVPTYSEWIQTNIASTPSCEN